MNAKQAIKEIVDEATDQELIALIGALAHPDKVAIGTFFSKLAADMAERIETRVGF
jgi:hypothetical protein